MIANMKIEDRMDGENNFRSWNHMTLLILEDSDLLDNVKQLLPEPKEEDAKAQIHTQTHIRPIARHKYIHLRSLVFVCKFTQGTSKVDRKIDLIDTH